MPSRDVDKRPWTVIKLIDWSANYLAESEIDSPRLTTELLLANVLECSRIQLYTRFDQPLSANELSAFKTLLLRRRNREPLQYILGECEFMGLRFRVDKRVLIPRPETEVLVEQALRIGKEKSTGSLSILDIGTGSGNIAVSLAKILSAVRVDACDVSRDALDLAKENAKTHGVLERIRFEQWDIATAGGPFQSELYDLILSNPPYISLKEIGLVEPEVGVHEPRIGTTDRQDGLTFYRTISMRSKDYLKQEGAVLVEVGYDQAGSVERIFRHAGFGSCLLHKDYAGINRVVECRLA